MDNVAFLWDMLGQGKVELAPSEFLKRPPARWFSTPTWERIEGMMLGLAIGDALGNTSESMSPGARRAAHGEIRDYLSNRHADGRRVGLPSDDTQLAFWALDQLNHDNGLMPDRMAHRFATGGEIYGIGRTMREFLRNFKSGKPWWESGPHSAGNGALMRIAPVLIPHLRTADERLWADTALLAAMSHNDSASNVSCVAFINLLWQLLGMDRPPDPEWWVPAFVGVIRQLGPKDYAPRGGKWAGCWSGLFPSYIVEVVGAAWEQGLSTLDACNSWHSGAYLLETVPSVLYILMRHGHDPEEAIIRAVNDTRDNDTVAAIVGAAVGALHGRDALPRRWIDGLLGRTGAHDDGRVFKILAEARRRWWDCDEGSPVIADHSVQAEAKGSESMPLNQVIAIAQAAGAVLRDAFNQPGGPRGSAHHAEADEKVEKLILERLTALFPEDGFLGEEQKLVRPCPQKSGRLWVVDPNDGTSAYMAGFRGSAVSIALLERGEPVLGVVYAFNYPDDHGDLIAWTRGGPVLRNGRPATRSWPEGASPEGVALLSHHADQNAWANACAVEPMRYRAVPSIAYRLALVAAGEGDAAVSLNAPEAWDLAGGHAVLLGAGGDLYDKDGRPVRYTAQGKCSASGWVFVGSPGVVEHLRARDWRSVFERPKRNAEYSLCWPRPGRGMVDAGMLARAQGCLLGQLAGDSLGSLVEFESPARIRRDYPGGVRELADGGTWNTVAGQPTDDSEMALLLARTLAQRGAYDPEAARRAYGYWLNSGPFDCGATISAGLRGRLNYNSQANGALMRISPLGVFGAGCDLRQVAEWARQDAALTHPHAICQQANALFAMAIAHAIRTGCAPQELYQHVRAWAEEMAVEQTLLGAIAGAAQDPPADYVSQQGWVLIAFRNALWQLLHAASLEEGVVDTVMRGGDTDTNAAICGALLGAVYGRGAIPARWIGRLLSCRPLAGLPGVRHPRPECFWPVDADILSEALLSAKPVDKLKKA